MTLLNISWGADLDFRERSKGAFVCTPCGLCLCLSTQHPPTLGTLYPAIYVYLRLYSPIPIAP
jgi:hypothetical protein